MRSVELPRRPRSSLPSRVTRVSCGLVLAFVAVLASVQFAFAEVAVSSRRDDARLRLLFNWSEEVDYSVTQTSELVILRFSNRMDAALDEMTRAHSDLFADIVIGGDGRVVVFRTKRQFDIRHHKDGRSVILDFLDVPQRAGGVAETVELSVTEDDDGVQSLAFEWGSPVEYRFVAEGRRGTIIFRRRGKLKIGSGTRGLSQAGITLSAAPTENSLLVSLVYNHDVELRALGAGNRVVVEARPRRPADREEPSAGQIGEGMDASVRLESSDDGPVLVFAWPKRVAAAAFRRGSYIWLVFGETARLDLTPVRQALVDDISDMEQLVIDTGTVLRFRTGGSIVPILERRSWDWRVTLFRGSAERQPSMTVRREAEAEGGRVVVHTGSGGPVLHVPDPNVGNTLIIVPVDASGLGIEERYRFPTIRLLPSAQGLVIEPLADGIQVEADGQDVLITRKGGMYLSPAGR